MPVTPGVATPTEIEMALPKGLDVLKFFPAEVLGSVRIMKAIAGPYRGVRSIPTRGAARQNLAAYVAPPVAHACRGSWLGPSRLISNGAFDEISRSAREAVGIDCQCWGS